MFQKTSLPKYFEFIIGNDPAFMKGWVIGMVIVLEILIDVGEWDVLLTINIVINEFFSNQ